MAVCPPPLGFLAAPWLMILPERMWKLPGTPNAPRRSSIVSRAFKNCAYAGVSESGEAPGGLSSMFPARLSLPPEFSLIPLPFNKDTMSGLASLVSALDVLPQQPWLLVVFNHVSPLSSLSAPVRTIRSGPAQNRPLWAVLSGSLLCFLKC